MELNKNGIKINRTLYNTLVTIEENFLLLQHYMN